jgi:hypothetical protein
VGETADAEFEHNAVLHLAAKLTAYLRFEVGLTRGDASAADGGSADLLREQLEARDREISRLRARLAGGGGTPAAAGIAPDRLVWIFGVARTGSSWLGAMMGDLDGHATWYEPYVGDVFGYAYYVRADERQRGREDYVLGDPHREAWVRSLWAFVLDGAEARFPELGAGGYLVVKEPNGSVGAPLLVGGLCLGAPGVPVPKGPMARNEAASEIRIAPLRDLCEACGERSWVAYHGTSTVTTLEEPMRLRPAIRRCVNRECELYQESRRLDQEGAFALPRGVRPGCHSCRLTSSYSASNTNSGTASWVKGCWRSRSFT